MTVVPDRRFAEVRAILAARRVDAADDRERAAVAAFAAALDGLERPFDTEAAPTHVTSSAIVVNSSGVVLHRHKRLGIWIQPGGHLDPGEDLATAGRREAAEETGLTLADPPGGPVAVHVDVHEGGRGHVHLDIRWLLIGSGEPNPPLGESPEVRWFPWSEAIARADPGLAGALRQLQPRLAFPR